MINFKQILEEKLIRFGVGADLNAILSLKIADETGIVNESVLILAENRLQFVKDSVRGKMDFSHDTDAKIQDSDKLVDHIATKVDPTSTNTHTQWVMNQYRQGKIRQEDFPRVRKALKGFETVKKNLANKDVNHFKGVSDLEDHVATQLHRTKSDIADKKAASNQVEGGLEHKFSEDGVTGFKIPNKAASVAYYGPAGKHEKTRWCTAAAGSNNMFNHYKGGKYTVHTPNNDVLQFHHQSGQIMDKEDHHVNLQSDNRFKPYAEHIKSFISQTAKEEGITGTSSLMQKTGAGMSKEEVHNAGEKLVSKISSGGWVDGTTHETLKGAPFSEEHLSHMVSHLTNNKEINDHYSNARDTLTSIAHNDNLSGDAIKKIHTAISTHDFEKGGNNYEVKNAVAKNENLPADIRSHYAHMDGFAERRDLSHDEMHDIVKEGSHTVSLLKNGAVHLPHSVQSAIHDKLPTVYTGSGRNDTRHALSARPDLHPDIADKLTKEHESTGEHESYSWNTKVDKTNLAKTTSPEVAMSSKIFNAKDVYDREDIPEEHKVKIVQSGDLSPGSIHKEHAAAAVESGKYNASQRLLIPGISKEHADAAATEQLSKLNGVGGGDAYSHPKVSEPIKREMIKHIHPEDLKDHYATAPHSHVDSLLETGNRAKISQIPQFKNVQKHHFDKLADDKTYHAAIVASKSAPPSVLTKLASSPSDYIRSKVAAHKNTPADVKSSITFDSSKV